MKNYFYSEGVFVPFEKVLVIIVSNDWTSIYVKVNNIDKSYEFPYIEITYYMDWLALKQQALVNQANPMLSIGSVEQTNKPEITPNLIDFLEEHLSIEPPCFLCKHEDEEEGCDECEYNPDPEKFAKFNKEWQES